MGDAVQQILLLSDWERYGLSERVCYHFDLTEALAPDVPDRKPSAEAVNQTVVNNSNNDNNNNNNNNKRDGSDQSDDNTQLSLFQNVCGVVGLLECVPFTPLNRLTKRQRRALRNEIRDFNLSCLRVQEAKKVSCHEPRRLPLRLNPASRLFFAYEVTRMVFCLDASPTLTSTFGGMDSEDGSCCPMDRVAAMAKTFFKALVEPIDAPSLPIQRVWRPEIDVSVIAVYPRGTGLPQTSLLVRDFRVHDMQSAEVLAQKIEEWALLEVESEIARRLSSPSTITSEGAPNSLLTGYDGWSIQLHSSSLRDILDAGDVSLSILSSVAKPCIVVATDGRSVSCDGVMDILADADRSDVPLVVLDLSSPHSHSHYSDTEWTGTAGRFDQLSLIQHDPGGPSTFPLHLSDDTEALYGICKATGGCFFDAELLKQAAETKAGQLADSPFHADHYFSFKRRSIKPNAVQWYILFSLSPLSPTFNSSWGKIVPPEYLRSKPQLKSNSTGFLPRIDSSIAQVQRERESAIGTSRFAAMESTDIRRLDSVAQRKQLSSKQLSRTTFSTYIVSPIRIKGLLMMRVKEGYRARQYGQSTQDTDKVLIQFNLPLELGTVLHYELSYKALPNQSHMVGVAHIKIELSGEPGFIQSVKHDFLRQTHTKRPETMAQQVSARLCKILRWIRREDCLQSYLCPLRWSDQLLNPETPFVRRLRTLTDLQRRKHFRFDQFDVVCTGQMPYALDDGFLSEFLDSDDDGEQELKDALSAWSTQTIKEGIRYIKKTDSSGSDLANYCVLELSRSPVASRVFTVAVEFFGGTGAADRLGLLASLRNKLSELKDVEVLSKQMADYVVGVRKHELDQNLRYKRNLLESQHHHASWDLVKDPELLPLIIKRRLEIGFFILLESSDDHALFAKLVPSSRETTEDLIQYQIAILSDRVVIDLHMESTCGDFFPFRPVEDREDQQIPQFHKIAKTLKRRDQECGHALRCRTKLLKSLDGENRDEIKDDENELSCVERLLPYANKVVRKLRFFHSGAGGANDVLQNLSEDLLLSCSFGVRVARLPIGPDENVGEVGKGSWFIIEFDRHTMSIVQYSPLDQQGTDESGESFTFRELTYFTIGISDLYSQRDDVADDDSIESHISEYLAMVEFADHWDAAHTKIYATAAYLALKQAFHPEDSFGADDLDQVMSVCEFVEVASVLVGGTPAIEKDSVPEAESKLQELMFTILGLVVGCRDSKERTLFYYKTPEDDESLFKLDEQEADSISAYDELEAVAELEDPPDDISAIADYASRSDDGFDRPLGSNDDENTRPVDFPVVKALLSPPVFVRFTLDGKAASLTDLSSITQSSNLAVQLSLFRDEFRASKSAFDGRVSGAPQLPPIHNKVALEVGALLNAYVAEQSLERLRHFKQELTEDDLKIVKACLRGARNVLRSKIDVYFYSGKIDMMVPAFAPAGREGAIAQGFTLLKTELQKNSYLKLQAFSGDVFVGMESKNDNALDFWCFINIRRTHISLKVHHPHGAEMAYTVMTRVQDMIAHCCHRVNQQLLLKRLHFSRTASELLIPKDSMVLEEPETEFELLFRPGVFSCPVVFATSFDLFHRCATNPAQVARKLEGTVLHSFAVSNRRNIFVYKDETGDVFYMMLESHGGGVEPDGKIDLLVYGIQEPGPSITSQLTQLLQRRLLLIAVDMLSAVLTKNPHFHWKRADLNFIRRFEEEWRTLDETYDAKSGEQIIDYELPRCRTDLDPGMILLYFRQNLCGSTFFHRLNEFVVAELKYDDDELPSEEDEISFNAHDFTFYYNNSPSKLDPKFQSVSTLTEKGAAYCRQAGAGIAIITVSLLHSNGDLVENVRFGVPVQECESFTDVPKESLLLSRASISNDANPCGHFVVRVSITSTALKLTALHSWVLLTLNQVYSAWCIERHLERMQCNLIRRSAARTDTKDRKISSEEERRRRMDALCPGLPAFISFVDNIVDLPHPAFSKTVNDGIIRASSVAEVTIDLLETIASFSSLETKKFTYLTDVFVIRMSRSEMPQRVKLYKNETKGEATARLAQDAGAGAILRDKPIDCPEYLCFYCHPQYSPLGGGNKNSPIPKLFKEVVVDDGNSDKSVSIARLEKLKETHPHFFFRSFAFVLSVKRNRRIFWAYNFLPQVLKKVVSRLSEKDNSFLKKAGQSVDSLQQRVLHSLSPLGEGFGRKLLPDVDNATAPDDRNKAERGKSNNSTTTSGIRDSSTSLSGGGATPRISRPTSIRRPKLIGKSVEGAAMQAVAASRARASNKQRFTRTGPVQSNTQPLRGQRDEKAEESHRPCVQQNMQQKSSGVIALPNKKELLDEVFLASKEKLDSLLASSALSLWPLSSRYWSALQTLTSLWWPSQEKTTVPCSVGDFILSRSSRTWSDVREVPPLPSRLFQSLVITLGQTIRMWTPGVVLFPVPLHNRAETNSVFLVGDVKSVRSSKCVSIFKIEASEFGGRGRHKMILRSQGWLATLPRHQKDQDSLARSMNLSLLEKDSAGLDKLATDLHGALDLDCLLFDLSGFLIERVMKSLDNRLTHDEIIPLMHNLIGRYPLEHQRNMTRLNYRIFAAPIVLSSYENRLINFYDSPVHYEWLYNHAQCRGLTTCGTSGLCFNKDIVLPNGVHAICFLTCDGSEPAKLELLIVCRTQGKDIHEYMFRNGSNIALTIMDHLAIEAAGIAYEELRCSARDLRSIELWTKASKEPMSKRNDDKTTREDIEELLVLVPPQPLLQRLNRSDEQKIALVMESGLTWSDCCCAMEKDPAFSPSHAFDSTESDEGKFHVFYIKDENLFLMFRLTREGGLLSLDLLSREERSIVEEKATMVIQKLTNYLLHYLWFSI